MGWCCGHGLSTAGDVARFYYDLLGPNPKIITNESLQYMKNFTELDYGWARGQLIYGAGLMVESYQSQKGPERLGSNSSFIGHDGQTYGFQSSQGYWESLNASMSIATNQDFDYHYPSTPMCHIVTIVSKYKGVEQNFTCREIEKPRYRCAGLVGQ